MPFLFRAPPLFALAAAAAIGAFLVTAEAVRHFETAAPQSPVAEMPVAPPARVENPFGGLIHFAPRAPEPAARLARAPVLDIDPDRGQVPQRLPEPQAEEPAAAPEPVQKPAPARRQTAQDAAPATPKRLARTQPRDVAAAPAPAPDNRGLFERLFNIQPSAPQTALAYARTEDGAVGNALRGGTQMPMSYADGRTAIYDISAKTVIMPNGEKLEAHSGLGPLLDNPDHVHVKNRGPTPPNVYDLSLRESLFHGVQAIRLNPVGGSTMYGRDGMLAHTYMLGPNGDSNGCVSFKDYNRFLQAYLNGEVKRLVVVPRRT